MGCLPSGFSLGVYFVWCFFGVLGLDFSFGLVDFVWWLFLVCFLLDLLLWGFVALWLTRVCCCVGLWC